MAGGSPCLMTTGAFITFEGGEGTGKSTQAARLRDALEVHGIACVVTREPGGSPFAESVRALILSADAADHAPLAEALLFHAARADHLAATIRPALAAGRWVICDRFSDSTRVYQGLVGGLPAATLDALDAIVVADTRPDLTIVLDMTAERGLERARQRRAASAGGDGADRYEARDIAFHERLRDGFLALAADEPDRCVVVDADRSAEAVARDVWAIVAARLEARIPGGP